MILEFIFRWAHVLFGIVGIILGPMLATVFVAVWGLYRESFAAQLGEA